MGLGTARGGRLTCNEDIFRSVRIRLVPPYKHLLIYFSKCSFLVEFTSSILYNMYIKKEGKFTV